MLDRKDTPVLTEEQLAELTNQFIKARVDEQCKLLHQYFNRNQPVLIYLLQKNHISAHDNFKMIQNGGFFKEPKTQTILETAVSEDKIEIVEACYQNIKTYGQLSGRRNSITYPLSHATSTEMINLMIKYGLNINTPVTQENLKLSLAKIIYAAANSENCLAIKKLIMDHHFDFTINSSILGYIIKYVVGETTARQRPELIKTHLEIFKFLIQQGASTKEIDHKNLQGTFKNCYEDIPSQVLTNGTASKMPTSSTPSSLFLSLENNKSLQEKKMVAPQSLSAKNHKITDPGPYELISGIYDVLKEAEIEGTFNQRTQHIKEALGSILPLPLIQMINACEHEVAAKLSIKGPAN